MDAIVWYQASMRFAKRSDHVYVRTTRRERFMQLSHWWAEGRILYSSFLESAPFVARACSGSLISQIQQCESTHLKDIFLELKNCLKLLNTSALPSLFTRKSRGSVRKDNGFLKDSGFDVMSCWRSSRTASWVVYVPLVDRN